MIMRSMLMSVRQARSAKDRLRLQTPLGFHPVPKVAAQLMVSSTSCSQAAGKAGHFHKLKSINMLQPYSRNGAASIKPKIVSRICLGAKRGPLNGRQEQKGLLHGAFWYLADRNLSNDFWTIRSSEEG